MLQMTPTRDHCHQALHTQAANAGPVSGPWSEALKADTVLTGGRLFLRDHPLGKQGYAGVSLTQDKWHRASRPMFKKEEEDYTKKETQLATIFR